MKLTEVLKTKLDLQWTQDHELFTTEFSVNDHEYGISVISDQVDEFTAIRVDFHFKNSEGRPQHQITSFNTDQYKVLGIVSNGIKSKFNNFDIIYFVAKLDSTRTDTEESLKEYNTRVQLYARLTQKLSVENNMWPLRRDINGETIFAICSTKNALAAFENCIGDTIPITNTIQTAHSQMLAADMWSQ
jgi:hypothetical protein